MPPSLLIVASSLLFAAMGVCVKESSALYNAGEIVFYRSMVGLVLMAGTLRLRGISWRTRVPGMHLARSASGTMALCLWFYALGGLPLATAMTLNYMSSVWIALFLLGGAVLVAPTRDGVDGRLVSAVLVGFAGVGLVLRPTIEQDQLWHGLMGLMSGVLSATAYLQVTALGRVGEPGERVVFYFSVTGIVAGAAVDGDRVLIRKAQVVQIRNHEDRFAREVFQDFDTVLEILERPTQAVDDDGLTAIPVSGR